MSGEGFLSRWSKRKQEVAREQEVATEPASPAAETTPAVIVETIEPHDPEAISPEELAALPPVEEIVNPADFAQYLRKGVPQILRNAAMRRMWLLDPAIRDYVDPALDYAYDWNIPGGVPGNGALAAGFDARGAADKFFSTMRGKISNETGLFAEAEERRVGHALLPAEDASTADAVDDATEGDAEEPTATNFEDAVAKNSQRGATLVVDEDASKLSSGTKNQVAQGRARRHGRALPV